jgi:hypothetical protein
MQHVLVMDKNKMPLMPCHPARARELLRKGKAAVYKRCPFRIILKEKSGSDVQDLQLKLDPGSKTTGIALMAECQQGRKVVWAGELTHRGQAMRNTLRSRVDNVFTWAKRLINFAPVSGIVVETVRFDTQLMQNPEISGVEYQQGELAGYEAREYLCKRFINILARAKVPLKDAAAINSIRYATGGRLKEFGLQVSFWSGGRTTYNRTNQSYGKSHWLDAVCVGATGGSIHIPPGLLPLHVSAAGRGSRRMCRVDTYGFPRTSAKARRVVNGCKTGDLVKALVNKGKKRGTYFGRCLSESPAVSIARQKRVQYRGLHGNIALFCSVPMVTATTEEAAFPPPPEGRCSHAVILDESYQTDH